MTKETDENSDSTLIGYARVSTIDQSLSLQTAALKKAGVLDENIYSESISGVKKKRPAMQAALRQMREGDTLVVWRLDRVARSVTGLNDVINELDAKGVKFCSITEGFDTNTIGGRLVFFIMGALAQFERDLIAERTQAGVDNAIANGVKFGREFKLKPEDMPKVWDMIYKQNMTRKEVADKFGVVVNTISRRLKEYEANKDSKES